jgi:exodeoxyribonuclease VII large subunit
MLFDESETNLKPQSVSELSGLILQTLEKNFSYVKIYGEISNCVKHSSGAYYFSVKDDKSAINVIIWKDRVKSIGFTLQNAMSVVVTGRVGIYAKSSRYSITASNIELYGEGQIMKIIEQRKIKLEKLGYFNKTNYLPIPSYPTTIGLITSQTGSVIEDIIQTLRSRFSLNIKLYNCLMQGQNSPKDIIKGLKTFAKLQKSKNKIDLLIIARGGGSMEDLFYFNDESLVIEIHKFCTKVAPVISAVGHATDTNLIDLVSTKNAITPTAAAQVATPDRFYLEGQINKQIEFIYQSLKQELKNKSIYLNSFDYKQNVVFCIKKINLELKNSFNKLQQITNAKSNILTQKVYMLTGIFSKTRAKNSMYSSCLKLESLNKNISSSLKTRLSSYRAKFESSLSLLKILDIVEKSNFCTLFDSNNNKIKSLLDLKNNDIITIKMQNDSKDVRVIDNSNSFK